MKAHPEDEAEARVLAFSAHKMPAILGHLTEKRAALVEALNLKNNMLAEVQARRQAEDQRDKMRERLDQFYAYGMPNVAAAMARIDKAEVQAADAEAALARVRALWPHIEIPAPAEQQANGKRRYDPGPPACLRCKIELAIEGAEPCS